MAIRFITGRKDRTENLVLTMKREELDQLDEDVERFGYLDRATYISDALSLYSLVLQETQRRQARLAIVTEEGEEIDYIDFVTEE